MSAEHHERMLEALRAGRVACDAAPKPMANRPCPSCMLTGWPLRCMLHPRTDYEPRAVEAPTVESAP